MDAYGYNALAGFFGSSSRKERRNEELQYMQAISKMQDQQQAQEDAQRQSFQQSIDQSYSIANDLLTGQHARQQDKEKIRQMYPCTHNYIFAALKYLLDKSAHCGITGQLAKFD